MLWNVQHGQQQVAAGHNDEVGDKDKPDDEEVDDAMVGDGEVGGGVRVSATRPPHNTALEISTQAADSQLVRDTGRGGM